MAEGSPRAAAARSPAASFPNGSCRSCRNPRRAPRRSTPGAAGAGRAADCAKRIIVCSRSRSEVCRSSQAESMPPRSSGSQLTGLHQRPPAPLHPPAPTSCASDDLDALLSQLRRLREGAGGPGRADGVEDALRFLARRILSAEEVRLDALVLEPVEQRHPRGLPVASGPPRLLVAGLERIRGSCSARRSGCRACRCPGRRRWWRRSPAARRHEARAASPRARPPRAGHGSGRPPRPARAASDRAPRPCAPWRSRRCPMPSSRAQRLEQRLLLLARVHACAAPR